MSRRGSIPPTHCMALSQQGGTVLRWCLEVRLVSREGREGERSHKQHHLMQRCGLIQTMYSYLQCYCGAHCVHRSLCAPRDVQLLHQTARALHLSCSARRDVARDMRHTLLCAERLPRHYARHGVNFLRRVSHLQTRTTCDAQMRKLQRYPPLSNAQTLTLLTSANYDLPG